jgi:hypothetical protein
VLFRLVLVSLVFNLLSFNFLSAQEIAFEKHQLDEEGYITHNLSKFKKRKKQTIVLLVKNTGDQPLQLEELELSCDCLKAKKLPKLPIPVGAITKIRIQHKAKDLGAFDVFAKLKSNAKNYPLVWIKLEGEVVRKH